MQETFSICGYTRISVDLEEDRDNTSIENQKAIIEDYVREYFPGSTLDLYVDRDRSGYTFSQREQYQVMRSKMLSHKYDMSKICLVFPAATATVLWSLKRSATREYASSPSVTALTTPPTTIGSVFRYTFS